MDTRIKGRLGSIKADINNLYLDQSIALDARASFLREIAIHVDLLVDCCALTRDAIESQSPTHIGADSDTLKASCTKQNHKRLYYQGIRECSVCETTLSP